MALNLEELSFQVNTEKLKDAIAELGNLRTAVSNLNSTSAQAATEQSKLVKSTEKLADSTEGSTGKLSAVEKMLDKTATKMKVLRGQTIELADGVENLGKGFTSSQASQVATARLLGATTDQIKMLTQSFKDYNDITGVNTFDASANGLSRLNKEITELNSVNQLAAKGYGLTREELKLLARDSNALSQAFKQEGKSSEELLINLARLEKEFVDASKHRNQLISQSRQVELQVKAEADSLTSSAKATAFLEREMLRMDNVLEGFNTNLAISSSNRLLKFREQLALSGVDATTAALKYEQYAERIRKADEHKAKVQKSAREDELKYLARATSVQLGDIGVSLAGGQNPFMVLIQQGDQLRGVLNQVGGDAKEMQQAMSLAFKQIVVGFVDVAKALGSFVAGALLDTIRALLTTMSEVLLLNKVFEAGVSKLDSMGFTKTAEFLRDFGAAASGVVATALAGFIVLLGTMAVALKDVIQEESALSKAMIVTGASFGLSKQAAIDYASSMEAMGVSQSKAAAFITELGKQGGFAKQAIDDLTKGAVDLAKYGGVSLEQTAQAAAKFQDKPYEALVKYAEQTGLVTVEQLKFVESLEEQGLTAEATTEAIRIMGQVTQAQADIAKASLIPVEQLWIDIKTSIGKAWEAIKELGRSESFINTLRIAFASLAAGVQNLWFGIKSIATGIGAYSAMFSAAISGDFTAAKNIFAEFSADITKEYKSIGDNFQQNLNSETSEGFKEGLKLTAQQMEKNVVGVKSYAAAQKLLDSVQGNLMKREEAAIKIRNVLTKAGYDELTIQKAIADFNSKHKDKSEKKSQAQKDAEAFEKLQDRLIDRSAGLEKSFSEQVALINKQAKTEEERVFLLEKLVKLQPSYLAGIKAELDTQLKIQKVWDDTVKEQAKVDKANFDALDAIDAKYATQVDAYDLLVLEASLIGKTAEEQKKVLGLKKIELDYEKEIEAIKNKQGIDDSTRKALLDKQLQIRKQAELNLNTEIANDAARKLLEEYNRIRDGISDAIVTALFEGGKAGSKKLRDFLVAELKRPITIYVQAVVSDLMGLAGIGSGSSSGLVGTIGSSISSMGSSFLGTGGIGAATSAFTTGASAALGGADLTAAIAAYTEAGMSGVAAGLSAGGSVGSALSAIPGWGWALAGAALLAGSMDDSGTMHTGGSAQYSAAGGTQTSTAHGAFGTGFGGVDYSKQTTDMVSGIAKGVSQMLDATAETFGKTAGYSVATAFADDTSKDGAWGALVVKLGDSLVTSWEDSRVSKWAPKVFADGEAGAKEYALAVAQDVRNVLMEQTPDWADTMLKALGDSPTLESLTTVVTQINAVAKALESIKEISKQFVGLSEEATTALVKALGGAEAALSKLDSYYNSFFTEEERKAISLSQLQKDFTSAGLGSIPKTREEYRKLVEAQDLTTEAGRKQYAELIKLAPAYASVTDSIEDTAKAAEDAATKAKEAAADIIRANEQIYNDAKSATDKALADTKEIINREKEKAQVALDAAATARDSLKSVFDLLQSNIKELYSEVSSTAAMQASEAGLIISNAASSGVIPSSDILSGAISTVRNSIGSTNYATKFEADKARLDFANNLKLIQDQAGLQLTESEQQVKLLKDQIEQYDLIIIHLDEQLKVLRGIDTSSSSISSALDKLLAIAEEERAVKTSTASASGAAKLGTAKPGFGGFAIGGGASSVSPPASSLSSLGNTYYGSLSTPITDAEYVSKFDSINSFVNTLDWSAGSKDASVDALISAAQQYGVSANEIAIATGYNRDDILALTSGQIPKFASGGMHDGGLRLVGENGPELEVTGPARYFNANQTSAMLSGSSDNSGDMEMLRAEVRATAQNTAKLARLVERLIVPTPSGEALQTTTVVA